MGSSLGPRKDLASALDRVAIVLIGVYIVLFIAAVIPPHFKDPRWLIEILDALRGIAFLGSVPFRGVKPEARMP
jgi:hypothetical protein